MYSSAWFDTFVNAMPAATTAAEVAAIARCAPPAEYPAVLDIGCGVGRVAAGLQQCGYQVTGIDINADAVARARLAVPQAHFIVLDLQHIDQLPRQFDVAVILWNGLGFGSREADRASLHGIASVLRPGGKLLLDLYHPTWLARNEQRATRDERGATIDRWIVDGRSWHRIVYDNGHCDSIDFNVYTPEEIRPLLGDAGLDVGQPMTWWDPARPASVADARYQLVCVREH